MKVVKNVLLERMFYIDSSPIDTILTTFIYRLISHSTLLWLLEPLSCVYCHSISAYMYDCIKSLSIRILWIKPNHVQIKLILYQTGGILKVELGQEKYKALIWEIQFPDLEKIIQGIPQQHLIFTTDEKFKDFLWDKTLAHTPVILVPKMDPEEINNLYKDVTQRRFWGFRISHIRKMHFLTPCEEF